MFVLWLFFGVQSDHLTSDQSNALVHLARSAVEAEVRQTELPWSPKSSPSHPVFVTIERDGRVIGCRGDLSPRFSSLEDEVTSAARAAAKHDPRYRPLQVGDLNRFLVTVTVVNRLEALSSVDGLMPKDGLVLSSGEAKGIVLPWEGKDAHLRLEWAYKKAGVAKGAPVTLYRMEAERVRG